MATNSSQVHQAPPSVTNSIGEREPPIVQKAEYELYNRGKGLDALVFTGIIQLRVALQHDLFVNLLELSGNLVFVGAADRCSSFRLESAVGTGTVRHVLGVPWAASTIDK